MSQSPKSETQILAYTFSSTLAITIVIYLLRGFGILTFIPGGIIWLTLLLAIASGTVYAIMKNRRY